MSDDSELDLLLDDEDLNSVKNGSEEPFDGDDDESSVQNNSHDDDDNMFDDEDEELEAESDKKKPSRPSRQSAIESEVGDEEEEDDEEAAKPAVSPLILGALALTVVGIGGAGTYVLLNKKAVSDEPKMVTTSMPAPSIDDLGKDISIPSTNLVDNNPNAVIGEDQADKKSPLASLKDEVVATETNQTAQPTAITPAPSVPVETVAQEATQAPQVPVVPVKVDSVSQGQNTLAASPAPVPVPQSVESPSTLTPVAGDTNSVQVSKDDIQKLVSQAVQEAVSEQHNEELKKQVEDLKQQLAEEKKKEAAGGSFEDYKKKVIQEIRSNKEESERAKQAEFDRIVEKTKEGKKRIAGFQVVNATADATISIIKAPSGRTFALFKGEKFRATNGVLLEVKEIVAGGKLVVAGDNWYIDDVLEKVTVSEKPVQQKAKDVGERRAKEPVIKPVASKSLSGWSFHASFEGGGYLVKTPSGEYKTVKKGTSEEGLGVIIGVDDNGNLKTDKGIISGNQ